MSTFQKLDDGRVKFELQAEFETADDGDHWTGIGNYVKILVQYSTARWHGSTTVAEVCLLTYGYLISSIKMRSLLL